MGFKEQKSKGPVWLISFYTQWRTCLLLRLCPAWLQRLQEVNLTRGSGCVLHSEAADIRPSVQNKSCFYCGKMERVPEACGRGVRGAGEDRQVLVGLSVSGMGKGAVIMPSDDRIDPICELSHWGKSIWVQSRSTTSSDKGVNALDKVVTDQRSTRISLWRHPCQRLDF